MQTNSYLIISRSTSPILIQRVLNHSRAPHSIQVWMYHLSYESQKMRYNIWDRAYVSPIIYLCLLESSY